MKVPAPLKLATDHDASNCAECAAATRDVLRRLARMERTCRCCGSRIPDEHVVYVVNEWRMCAVCWRAGYQAGETVDA